MTLKPFKIIIYQECCSKQFISQYNLRIQEIFYGNFSIKLILETLLSFLNFFINNIERTYNNCLHRFMFMALFYQLL
jgi:hypothetical protein